MLRLAKRRMKDLHLPCVFSEPAPALFQGLAGMYVRVAEGFSGSHESSLVGKNLDKESIEYAPGAVVFSNEHWTQSRLSLMIVSLERIVVQSKWMTTVCAPLYGWQRL